MDHDEVLCVVVAIILLPIFLILLRLIWILPALRLPSTILEKRNLNEIPNGSTMAIFLGSGGHTGEMLRLISKLNLSKFTRTWIYSSGDNTSIKKATEFEEAQLNDNNEHHQPQYLCIPRARKVGEPILLSIISTLYSFIIYAIKLVFLKRKPSILLLNGPGTTVPIAYIIFTLKFLGICNTKIIYVESLARVNKLSLSGLLLLPICDRFIVQWESLAIKYKRAEYYGILI